MLALSPDNLPPGYAGPRMNMWVDIPVDPPEELPEFHFTKGPKYLSRHFLCIDCEQPIHEKPGQRNHYYVSAGEVMGGAVERGPLCPPCAGVEPTVLGPIGPFGRWLRKPRPLRATNTPGKADPIWDTAIQLKKFKEPRVEPKLPWGVVPFYPGLSDFLNKDIELQWLIETQNSDPPTVDQELRSLGWKPSSKQSEDDDASWDVLSARHLPPQLDDDEITPTWVDEKVLQNRIRAIERERDWMLCSQPVKVWLEPSTINPGRYRAETNDVRLTAEEISTQAQKLLAVIEDTPTALEERRGRVLYYQLSPSDLFEPVYDEPIKYDPNDLGAEDLMEAEPEDDENPRAPVELSLHNPEWTEESSLVVAPEPQPSELWPEDYPFNRKTGEPVYWDYQSGLRYDL